MMFAFAAAYSTAVVAYQEARLRAQSEQRIAQLQREIEQWEDDKLLPLMSDDEKHAFLAERRRVRERREDVARQERMHRELVAVENRKAAALERQASKSSLSGIGLGIILGSVLDGD
jgi:hypothetical protein